MHSSPFSTKGSRLGWPSSVKTSLEPLLTASMLNFTTDALTDSSAAWQAGILCLPCLRLTGDLQIHEVLLQ